MEKQIFKKSSMTYYWSSRFFPKHVRGDVYKLYSFVRVADDFVDSVPQDKKSFLVLKKCWETNSISGDEIIDAVVLNINHLTDKYRFKTAWVDSFLHAMEQDLHKTNYTNLREAVGYVYGSAEVVGLMMAKILDLPKETRRSATYQGRAMQWINFIRDINEDNILGRSYFPSEDYKKFDLGDLSESNCRQSPINYEKFIQYQLERYKRWQAEAETGYKYIPKRLLIPIKTASDMYNWTANEIEKDPFIVFQKKVKPSKYRVLFALLKNIA